MLLDYKRKASDVGLKGDIGSLNWIAILGHLVGLDMFMNITLG